MRRNFHELERRRFPLPLKYVLFILCRTEGRFTFTLILAEPGPGVVDLTPEVHPALPDDVVPGAGELVQVPGQDSHHTQSHLGKYHHGLEPKIALRMSWSAS